MIEGYTREAGVRTLERTVGSVCRKIAVQYASDKSLPLVTVDENKAKELLGAPRFTIDTALLKPQIGAAVGLAWTAVGGTTLTVEAAVVKGKGEVKLTGKLGDVMKESAMAAFTYLRAHAQELGLDPDVFKDNDLHIHVPEGATPKDGPSAGITLATAALSAFGGQAVRGDIAMTGEITLRGNVLPIGGLKEKALAARRVGIREIIIPAGNEKDLDELPKTIRKELTFYPVKTVSEVFELALTERKTTSARKKRTSPKRMPVLNGENEQDSVRC